MKKLSIITAMAALVLGFASCSQETEPRYQDPTTFTVAVPGLQDQEFTCSNDLTDNATFNLFCTQPDYGYSAICNYSALVSLDPECPVDDDTKTIEIEATNPTSAAMAIKTYELGVAITKLAGYNSQEEFDADPNAAGPYKVYMRAVCEISAVEGSRIVSSNVVSYNNVKITFAQKQPAWIYICGQVQTLDNSVQNGFLAPNSANLDVYKQYWSLFEPDDMIGEKIYVGQFNLIPQADAATLDVTDPDQCATFRFFTELLGWTTDASLGSNEADFYCENITDKSGAGYTGDIVYQGLGNWGIAVAEPTPVTIVVDQSNLKVYIKEGLYNVTFQGRDPNFE